MYLCVGFLRLCCEANEKETEMMKKSVVRALLLNSFMHEHISLLLFAFCRDMYACILRM